MIIVPVKDGENIERALKKFKRKFEQVLLRSCAHASSTTSLLF